MKCIPKKDEITISQKVSEMRKALQGSVAAEFIRLYNYCQIESLEPYQEFIEETDGPNPNFKKSYYAIIMQSVPLQFSDASFFENDAISLGFELLYTIWIARKSFQFFHGDLHSGNIMFKVADKKERRYIVGGKTFLINFKYTPVMIDFEKSLFSNDDPKRSEKFSDVRRITEIMADAFGSKHAEPESFQALYSKVRQDSFKDSRFTPNIIEEILTDPNGVFNILIEKDGGGGDESKLKKLKYCVGCKVVEAQLMCNMCGVTVCSPNCWKSIDSCLKKHTRRHGKSDSSDEN